MPKQMIEQNNPSAKPLKHILTGVGLMLFAYLCFVMSNAFVKDTTTHYATSQILFMRCLWVLVPLAAWALVSSKLRHEIIHTPILKMHFLRGFLTFASLWLVFYGFKILPFANANAIAFLEVIFMNIFASYYLKEPISWRQWVATIIGFMGFLLVVRPSGDLLDIRALAAFGVMLGVCLDGVVVVMPRKLGKTDSVWVILFYYAFFSTLFSGLVVLWEGWTPLTLDSFGKFLGVGGFSFIGQIAATFAYQYAPTSVLAPTLYSILIWACLLGYVFWGEVPHPLTWVGSVIVIVSGLYIIQQEKKHETQHRS